MLRKIILFTILLGLSHVVSAQRTIKGQVTMEQSAKPVDGANIMLHRVGSKSLLGFVLTGADGSYSIDFQSDADTLALTVSGFNIKSQDKILTKEMKEVNFSVSFSELTIKEVKVKADPISRKKDTLTYYVEQFRDSTDRSIGDVLKKLPGIQVSESGGIQYNGRPINKLYIEGLDMLGSKYGIATKNVQARDIAAVEVYENHQPIEALRRWVKSDEAAINLKLKQGAKGTWNGVAGAGIGYKPLMWDGQFTPMLFSKKFQTIITYKGNDMGHDSSKELRSQLNTYNEIPKIVGIKAPVTPPLDEATWLRNGVHATSFNAIVKLHEKEDLTVLAHYIHDKTDAFSEAETQYFLPDGTAFSISEGTSALNRRDEVEASIQYRVNSPKKYLTDAFAIGYKRNAESGVVDNASSVIGQRANLPIFQCKNELHYIKAFEKWRLSVRSNTDFGRRHSYLKVSPNILPNYVDSTASSLYQGITARKFSTRNTAGTSYHISHWDIGISAEANIDIEDFQSDLTQEDKMRNDMGWARIDLGVTPTIGYAARNLSTSLNVPLSFVNIHAKDHIGKERSGNSYALFIPSLLLNYSINYQMKMVLTGSYYESLSGLYDLYPGYVMTNYRSLVSKKDSDISRTRSASGSLEFSISDDIHAIFINTAIRGSHGVRNTSLDTSYDGILSTITAVHSPIASSNLGIDLDISKRISSISTTLKLGGKWNRNWSELRRQGQLLPVIGDNISMTASIHSRMANAAILSYYGTYTHYRSSLSLAERTNIIDNVNQSLSLNFLLGKRIIAGGSLSHYFNSNITGSSRNMAFFNLNASYKYRKIEYIIEGNNIFNTRRYGTSSISTNTIYSALYRLRPTSVCFKVIFSLR